MFILLYANCVVMYCVSFYVVVGNKLDLILSYLILHKLMSIYFVAHFCITHFRVAVRDKASLKIACIGHSVLGVPQGTICHCL